MVININKPSSLRIQIVRRLSFLRNRADLLLSLFGFGSMGSGLKYPVESKRIRGENHGD